ncbi:MAG: CHAD domain-containing protein [Rhodothermales bacterium]
MATKSTIRPAMARSLKKQAETFIAAWKRVRVGAGEAESVHDVRVAARRLLAAIGLIESVAPKVEVGRLRRHVQTELKRFALLRELQITPGRLTEFVSDQTDDEILGQLTEHESRIRELVLASMDNRQVRRIKKDVSEIAKRLVEGGKRKREKERIRTHLSASVEAFLSTASVMRPDDAASVHRARMSLKQLRYDLELAGLLLGKKTYARLAASAEKVQDSLGNFQDLTIAASEVEAISGSREQRLSQQIRMSAAETIVDRHDIREFEDELVAQFD